MLEGYVCSICLLPFDIECRVPKALPCSHTFCSACLLQLYQKGKDGCTEGSRIPCSLCNAMFHVNSSEEFRKNDAAEHLVRIFLNRGVEEDSDSPGLCSLCDADDESAAEWYCGACHVMLCCLHTQLHKRARKSSGHLLVEACSVAAAERGRVRRGESGSAKSVLMCGRHKGEKLRYYCQDCDDLTCLDCYNSRHKQHAVHEINETLALDRKTRLDTLWQMLTCAFGARGPSVRAIQEFNVEHGIQIVENTVDTIVNEVESQGVLLHEVLRSEGASSAKASQQHQQHLDHVRASAQSLCWHWEKARSTLTPVEVLVAFPGLLAQMEQLLGQPFPARPRSLSLDVRGESPVVSLEVPGGSPVVTLAVPALQPFAHAVNRNSTFRQKRRSAVSTCVSLPEGKGTGVAVSYDVLRDAVWVATSLRWVGCFHVGHRAWTGEWFRLHPTTSHSPATGSTASSVADTVTSGSNVGASGLERTEKDGIHALTVMANGLCYIIPSTRDKVEAYDRRGYLRSYSVCVFPAADATCAAHRSNSGSGVIVAHRNSSDCVRSYPGEGDTCGSDGFGSGIDSANGDARGSGNDNGDDRVNDDTSRGCDTGGNNDEDTCGSGSSNNDVRLLSGLSCCGEDLIVTCEGGSVFVVEQKFMSCPSSPDSSAPPWATPALEFSSVYPSAPTPSFLLGGDRGGQAGLVGVRVFNGSGLGGRLVRAHVSDDGVSLTATVLKDDAADVITIPLRHGKRPYARDCDLEAGIVPSSNHDRSLHSRTSNGREVECVGSFPGKHGGAFAWSGEAG
eukprot:Rmarinus@m.21444